MSAPATALGLLEALALLQPLQAKIPLDRLLTACRRSTWRGSTRTTMGEALGVDVNSDVFEAACVVGEHLGAIEAERDEAAEDLLGGVLANVPDFGGGLAGVLARVEAERDALRSAAG